MDTIRWGKRKGKQRYKCRNCGILFTDVNPERRKLNQQIWFKKWVIERLTFRYLTQDSGHSISTLKRLFKWYLLRPPLFQIRSSAKVHLLIDGTYFSNDLCLILYQDNEIKHTQLYRFSTGEYYNEICEDLENLGVLGIQIESITCDGHKATLKAIKKVYPDLIIQRCVVHVHRMANIWLRQKPKTQASIELKIIINLLPLVQTHNDRIYFTQKLLEWFKYFETFINEKATSQSGRWWYKHKYLKRATTLISKALPNLFHYLDNPKIPKSTNGLESFFGHLKDNLSIHRGLSFENRKAFILWYLHFKNQSRH